MYYTAILKQITTDGSQDVSWCVLYYTVILKQITTSIFQGLPLLQMYYTTTLKWITTSHGHRPVDDVLRHTVILRQITKTTTACARRQYVSYCCIKADYNCTKNCLDTPILYYTAILKQIITLLYCLYSVRYIMPLF